jgi:DNA-binding response OmpR family regulator
MMSWLEHLVLLILLLLNREIYHCIVNLRHILLNLIQQTDLYLLYYESFLKDYDYDIISFTDPFVALNYIRDRSNFNDLLVILDIRMKNLNGFQLHQQIKAIDPTIKILFITALDILDELLIPSLSKDQTMKKPVDKKVFTNTIQKILH